MGTLIKLLISIAFFYIVFKYINFDEVATIVNHSDKMYILLALVFQLISTYIAATRWYLIMSILDFHEKFSFYVKSYFTGSFFNQALPSSIGGDAVRILELSQRGYKKRESFYGVFVDRVVGVVGLLVLNLTANILFYGSLPLWLFQLINVITIVGILGFIFLMKLHHIQFLSKYKGLDLFHRLSKRISNLYQSKKLLILHTSISIVVHVASIFAIYFLARSVGINLPFEVFLVAMPPIFLLTIVPISLAGWGVREGAMVGVFIFLGAVKAEILSVSILYGLILIVSSLPGSLFWLENKKEKGTKI